jgi:lipid-A-disaccharide synthase
MVMSPQDSRAQSSILFTAFEPSGDAHAAPVIQELRRDLPQVQVYAWGGPAMKAAGATIVQETAVDGAMGAEALTKVFALRREVRRIKRWSREARVLAHVAVDSPAANFPICKVMRKSGARIVHLVAPQLWAWGRWRVGKLRRLTDLVLCLLPFEEAWFRNRRIPARFIGHPAVNRPIEMAELREQIHGLPSGAPRIVIFPGSRSHEVRANIRLLVDVYTELQGRHGGLAGVIVAANPAMARIVRRRIKVYPRGLHMVTGNADAAITWCDLALAVSGTITLHLARQRKPMIGVYKTGWFSWLGSRLVIRSRFKLLPNIIADREIVPEFVPYTRGPMPIVKQATYFLHDSKHGAVQSEELARVCLRFAHRKPAEEAAALIAEIATGKKK